MHVDSCGWYRLMFKAIWAAVASALAVALIVFLAVDALPVDPTRAALGSMASAEQVAQLRAELGLDQPVLERLARFVWNLVRGDFGTSFFYGRPVSEILVSQVPPTLARAFAGLTAGVATGLASGRWVAGSRFESLTLATCRIAQATPALVCALVVSWVASQGMGVSASSHPIAFGVLAASVASIAPAAVTGQFVLQRLSSAPPAHADFLRMLGAPEAAVRHILWYECLPAALMLALNSATGALTAVFFCELVFGLKGFGSVFYRSCARGDVAVVIGGTVVLALLFVFFQRIGDIVGAYVDPRR